MIGIFLDVNVDLRLVAFITPLHYLARFNHPTDFDESRYESILACAVIAHYSTCLADTLASELGILSKSDPFLLTSPWRKVPPGTNGGVTMNGFFLSFIGGVLMGGGTMLMDTLSGIDTKPLEIIIFSGTCGLLGSVLDSLLGATVQATYYDPDKKLIYCSREDAPKTVEHMRIKCLYKCSSEPCQCLIDLHDWGNLLWTSDILIKPMPFIVNFVCVHSSTLHNVAELYIVQRY